MITVLDSNQHPKLPSDDSTSMTFNAPANQTTSLSLAFIYYTWIDSSYNAQNVGNEVIDPLQDAKITVSWSETSQVVQVR